MTDRDRLKDALRKIRDAGLGPDRGSAQWTLDLCRQIARDALAALPAPVEATGEVVEVRADVFRARDGRIVVREQGYMILDLAPSYIATIRARVPLPRVPEVVGEVEG